MSKFSEAKQKFDDGIGRPKTLSQSLVLVDGKSKTDITIRNPSGEPLEEYHKWQFVYALINSGLYPKDYIGVEVRFPKGSKGARDLKIDGVIFDDAEWPQHYKGYWHHRRSEDLQWLNNHLLSVIEFKRDDKEIEQVLTRQVKPAMREKDPSDSYILGMYYAAGRLFLFHRRNGKYLRYDEAKNQKGDRSQIGDLSLHIPDPYLFIPSFGELKNLVHRPSLIARSKRGIKDLDIITSITTAQMRDALSNVLRIMDKNSLVNQRGYEILLQTFASKIFDEKRNERAPLKHLEFYVTSDEGNFATLGEGSVQRFINRLRNIQKEAVGKYKAILEKETVDWKDPSHIRIVVAVCESFQDFSFVRSSKSDLYQLVFYNFANRFQQQEKAQFLTPLPIIDFLVKITNPRSDETVFDPCCGIADFLSLSYVNAQNKPLSWQLDDNNIYGTDLSTDMITLATLNMLLNGDGNAHMFYVPDKGSILYKVKKGNPPEPIELIPSRHKTGNWDDLAR